MKFGELKMFKRTHDPIWQLQLGIVGIMILQFLTDSSFLPFSKLIIIGVEFGLLIAMTVLTSDGYSKVSRLRRSITIGLIMAAAAINAFSLAFLVREILFDGVALAASQLLLSGFTIYVTNIFIFALLYWEMDGGGPDHRVNSMRRRDFAFPQNLYDKFSSSGWRPGFIDYLYLSSTNVTNFASADTMPVTPRAKLLMMAQALIALVTVVLVAARAISIF